MSRVIYANTPDRSDQERVRALHGVRLVREDEEGTGVNALPGGVYGYTYSPGLPNAPLFAGRRFRSYETHKLVDGDIYVIAYADAETAKHITDGATDTAVRVYAEPHEAAPVLVQIAYARIRQHRQHAAPNQEGFFVSLAGPVSTGR